jgi:phosphate transport system permease protein
MTLDTDALTALDDQFKESRTRTTVTNWSPPTSEPTPRRIGGLRRTDVLAVGGAAVSALGMTALLFTLLPLSGLLGFVIVAYLLFIVVYAVLVSMDETRSAVRDRVAATVIHSIAFLMLLALVFVVVFTVLRGWEALVNSNFYTQDMSAAGPLDPLDMGGVFHAIVGTLIIIAIALVVVIPLGIACAVFLNEIPGPFSRLVRTITEAMTALPSIVAGLFIYASLILIFGLPKSGFAAALAISVMMLPIMIRSADVVLRLVPGSLKEAAYALGAGQWSTVWRVTLPTAKSGLMTSIILGTAMGIGETAPVLLTAGFTASLNTNPTSGPMISLPLATWEFVKSPEPSMIARGFGTAAVLMLLVLILFAIARIIGGRGPGNLTKMQQRRRAKRSREDSQRFTKVAAARVASADAPAGTSSGPRSLDFGDSR